MALSDLLRTLEQEAAACTEEVRSRARREGPVKRSRALFAAPAPSGEMESGAT